jgi:hypothetical protein
MSEDDIAAAHKIIDREYRSDEFQEGRNLDEV